MPTGTAQIAVVGAGPAGLAAALALASFRFDVALIAPPHDRKRTAADRRTTALIGPSIELLRKLGTWDHCLPDAAPIAAVRIADDREALLRTPEIVFRAAELGLESFGANVPNFTLLDALDDAATRDPHITRLSTRSVRQIVPGIGRARLHLAEGGTVEAPLVVAADGRSSIAPSAAGIAVRSWEYRQCAIAASFGHSRPHEGIVNELHRRPGPLTTVPLPGARSSLVWAEEPREADRLATLDGNAFAAVLEERLQGLLGAIGDVGPRATYPLVGLSASSMGASRIALVGEAAHVIPPIGAQGLNIGLRDAAVLADCARDARERGHDIGGPELLAAYNAARSADVAVRSISVDLLNRSLLTDFLPVEIVRGLAVQLIAGFSPLRRLLMQAGMGLTGPLPRLMQPNATQSGP